MKLIPPEYGDHYSESGLFDKLRALGGRAWRGLAEKALILFVVLTDPATPAWARAAIVAGLSYLICPIDTIPDLLPGVGLTDDLAVLTALVGLLSRYITPRVRAKARRLLSGL